MHLLVIEDDPRLVRLLRRLLEEDRHVVETATTGQDGLDIAEATTGIELVILDVGLPDISGLEVARRIRASGSSVPILMLDRSRHRRRPGDRPRCRRRRLPRQAVRLRGAGGATAGTRPTWLGRSATDAEVRRRTDRARREPPRGVTVDGRDVDLSPREFSLLECLLRHPGQTLTRDQLLDQAWPFSVAVTPNAVDAYVHYLRDKLGTAGKLDPDGPRRRATVWPMPDGDPPPAETTAPELAADYRSAAGPASPRHLVLWSGGTTLVILIALAAGPVCRCASSLASAGVSQLDAGWPRSVASDPTRTMTPAMASSSVVVDRGRSR